MTILLQLCCIITPYHKTQRDKSVAKNNENQKGIIIMKKIIACILSIAMIAGMSLAIPFDSFAATENIYTGFSGMSSVDDFSVDTNYVLFEQTFSSDDAVISLPDGGAELRVTGKDSDKVYVSVVKKGSGFDNCSSGRIEYNSSDSSWHYWCSGGAVQNRGPFYAYSFSTDTFTEDDISAEVSGDVVTKDTVKTYVKEDISVYVTVNGTKYSIPYYTLTDGTIDMPAGDDEITVTVGSISKTVQISVNNNPVPKKDSKKAEPEKTPMEIREAIEEDLPVAPVSVDETEFNKTDDAIVPETTYNLSNFITTKGIVKGLNAAVAASNKAGSKTVTIYSGKPLCFNETILKTIQDGKKDVTYFFKYKGHLYSVTIPATVDAAKVLEQAGFAGPFYVGQQLGTTKLVK